MDTALTRRGFLHTGLAMVSTVASAPGFVSRAAAQVVEPNDPDQHRVLVVIQLSGGNDGLNTVIPYGDPAYYRARPRIGIAQRDLIVADTGLGLGLHPSLGPVMDLIEQGRGAILQGVGYPNPNRSHFASMDVWHTGDALRGASGGDGTGWLGRAMDQAIRGQTDQAQQAAMAMVALGAEAPLATLGHEAQAVAFENAANFRWLGRDLHPAVSQAYDQLTPHALEESIYDPNSVEAFVYRTQMDAQVASDKIRDAVNRQSKVTFPRTGLGNQLKMVAEMIKAELPTTVYYVALGGFDTHANQIGLHQRLMDQFAQAVKAFQDELAATGQADRVLTMAFSEFGRRVAQNASQGTDHGAAGPAFIFGTPQSVQAGVHGTHPSLTDLDKGDLKYTTDFRSLYSDVLSQWLQLDAQQVLSKRFASTGVLQQVRSMS